MATEGGGPVGLVVGGAMFLSMLDAEDEATVIFQNIGNHTHVRHRIPKDINLSSITVKTLDHILKSQLCFGDLTNVFQENELYVDYCMYVNLLTTKALY